MKQIVKPRSRARVTTYSHAYDEFNNLISIDDAINLDSRTYYRYGNKEVEFENVNFKSGAGCYWRCKPNQFITIKGESHLYSENKESESYAHKYFKAQIIIDGFFNYRGNIVRINNAHEERRIDGSYFVSDVKGEMLDGTPCIIEVIRTSDLTEHKLDYIEDKQILTFKIYIDEYGNQEFKRDCIVGNQELTEIKRSIQDGEGKIAELRDRVSQARKDGKEKMFKEISDFSSWLADRLQRTKTEINQLRKKCESITEGNSSEIIRVESKLRRAVNQVNGFIERIERGRESISTTEKEIKEIEEDKSKFDDYEGIIRGKIKAIEKQSSQVESQFNEIAENCKIEWFRNKWMTGTVQDKIEEIKYWTT